MKTKPGIVYPLAVRTPLLEPRKEDRESDRTHRKEGSPGREEGGTEDWSRGHKERGKD